MTTRISTSGLADSMMRQMQTLQSQVVRTQELISSGRKFIDAKDNPVVVGAAVALDRADSEYTRFGANADVLNGRLSLQETTLANAGDIMLRLRDLAIQSNNATLDLANRNAIVTELNGLKPALMALANADDGEGGYLFAGSSGNAPPFVQLAGLVSYVGDQSSRQIAVAPGTTIADTDPGSEIFMRIRAGNGFVVSRATGTNTGTSAISTSGFTDQSQWINDNYTVSFAGGNYQVTDSASVVVAAGVYTTGQAIAFRGYQLTLSGTPANGDSYAVSPAPSQDIFSIIDALQAALQTPDTPVSAAAARQNQLYAVIEDLSGATNHIIDVRASTGARLNSLEAASREREGAQLNIKTTLSQLRDLDYAEALSTLARQSAALQASQQTFTKIQSLSLFDYLR